MGNNLAQPCTASGNGGIHQQSRDVTFCISKYPNSDDEEEDDGSQVKSDSDQVRKQ